MSLRSYDELNNEIMDNVIKLDRTKSKSENAQYLNMIKKDGNELLEVLIFKLIMVGDFFFGNFAIQLERKIDPLLPAPAAVSFRNNRYYILINPLMFCKFTIKEQMAILVHE